MKNLFSLVFGIISLFPCLIHASEFETPDTKKSNILSENKNKFALFLKNQPVEFTENKGQMLDTEGNPANYILFRAEAPGVDLYITEKGLSYVFVEVKEEKTQQEKLFGREEKVLENKTAIFERLDMELKDADIRRENIIKEDSSVAFYNFLGLSQGAIYKVRKYKRVTIKNVYPGIDWVLYNSSGTGFKYDFVVNEGADPSAIQLLYKTNSPVTIDQKGQLTITSEKGQITENAPYSFWTADGASLSSKFKLLSSSKKNNGYETLVGFDLDFKGSVKQKLIIDPQLVWATFFGGNGLDGTTCLQSDSKGNLYATGYTSSLNFPLANGGNFNSSLAARAFLIKFSNSGNLLWGTYFVDNFTYSSYLTVDATDNIYLCGGTSSPNFPLINNNTFFQSTLAGVEDAFITKFDTAGTIIWSTFYGGSNYDQATVISTDPNNNVFISGSTASPNFPTQNAGTYYESVITGTTSSFILKFDNNGNRLWATFIKGLSNPCINLDPFGSLYLAGKGSTVIPLTNPGGGAYYQANTAGQDDGCIFKFTNSGVLNWCTLYGGSAFDMINSVVTDNSGNSFLLGYTTSPDWPLQNAGTYFQSALGGGLDLFFLKFDSTGVRLWSTYFGGSSGDSPMNNDHLDLDQCGNLYFGAATTSQDFPVMAPCEGGFFDNAMDISASPPKYDLVIGRFSNSGVYQWGSYAGGDGMDFRNSLDIDIYGNIFMTGEWAGQPSNNTYPLTNPGGQAYFSNAFASDDSYFLKFDQTNSPATIFSFQGPYCEKDNNLYLPVTASGFMSGGTFSSAAGLTLNYLTGQITPSLSMPGTYTVVYSYTPCYCLNGQLAINNSATVSIIAAPSLTVTGSQTLCIGQPGTIIASGAPSYSWSNGSTNPTLNIVAPPAPGVLTYSVTGFANAAGCNDVKTFTVNVNRCTDVIETPHTTGLVNIFPNPNSGEFVIECTRAIQLELSNELGQVLMEFDLNASNKNRIKVQGLAKGVYFVAEKNNPTSSAQKLVVTD